MSVPKKRHSYTRKSNRRSHDFLVAKNVVSCSQCGSSALRHRVCPTCGYYRGKLIVDMSAKETPAAESQAQA